MKRRSTLKCLMFLICLASMGLCFSLTVQAQSLDRFVISAKAGGVNLVSGRVLVKRERKEEWSPLTLQSGETTTDNKESSTSASTLAERNSINSGDAVRTEETGRFEMLLNPGSYLRLSENSEVELIDTSLDNLRLKIVRGNAILEATGGGDIRLLTEILTPQTKIIVLRTGIYRINVSPAGTTELLVRKGRAEVGTDSLTTVKDGKRILISGSGATVAKFDKKSQDSFDLWSRERAQSLIAQNKNLPSQTLANAILNTGWRPLRNYSGLWVYDPFLGSYTFFPLYSGWNSPYGYGYDSGFGVPFYHYRPRPVVNYPGGGGGSAPGGGNPGTQPPVQPSPTTPEEPHPHRRGRRRSEGDEIPIRPYPERHHRGDGESGGEWRRNRHENRRSGGEDYQQPSRQQHEMRSEPRYEPRSEPVYTPPPQPAPQVDYNRGDAPSMREHQQSPQL